MLPHGTRDVRLGPTKRTHNEYAQPLASRLPPTHLIGWTARVTNAHPCESNWPSQKDSTKERGENRPPRKPVTPEKLQNTWRHRSDIKALPGKARWGWKRGLLQLKHPRVCELIGAAGFLPAPQLQTIAMHPRPFSDPHPSLPSFNQEPSASDLIITSCFRITCICSSCVHPSFFAVC